MIFTLLQIIPDSTMVMKTPNVSSGEFINYWMWIAIIELGIIAFMTFKLLRRKRQKVDNLSLGILRESRESEVDMDNVINSINKSRELYKQLSAKCHPDRFSIDEQKRVIAEGIFQEITKEQRNYNRLLELKQKAEEQLDITI